MKLLIFTISLAVSLITLSSAHSAEPKPEQLYSYSSYFVCDVNLEPEVDAIVKKNYAPLYDAAVKDGTIKGWGWMKHHTGGNWRRILYHVATSVDGTIQAQHKIGKAYADKHGTAPDAFSKGCKTHEDYIWQFVDGSNKGKEKAVRGKVGMSVYIECTFTGDERADEIVKKVFAPVYNAHLGKGKLTSWGWLSHVVGGKYRKLGTMTAENYSDLLKARESILNTIFGDGKNKAEGEEFSKICTSHQDYLWAIDTEM